MLIPYQLLVYLVGWACYFYFLGILQLEPSLEEEDTDNESLLDSMEHIQDFSQVFKDLKNGIFQMIKLI
ncbi:hypothetical protein, conserved [Plasmodium vivax]|uniref:Uncharacterized protein n=1 Tax=Plasmodium vivax TaxID=5855 RepID=A0A1G4E9T0_PLAVI|nr:hypothetical protein, conserved [Plasmodium vivax]